MTVLFLLLHTDGPMAPNSRTHPSVRLAFSHRCFHEQTDLVDDAELLDLEMEVRELEQNEFPGDDVPVIAVLPQSVAAAGQGPIVRQTAQRS